MIKIITELQAIAQTGIAYSKDKFDIGRFKRILEISAELQSFNAPQMHSNILEYFSKDSGYATPKVDIRGAVFKDNKILLVRESEDGCWSLPGGWADVNLSPSENIIKEIKEEAGFECEVAKLIGVYDKSKRNIYLSWPYTYKIFFLCSIIDISKPSVIEDNFDEIIETGFFGINYIPPLSESRVTYAQIQKCFDHYYNQNLMPEFD